MKLSWLAKFLETNRPENFKLLPHVLFEGHLRKCTLCNKTNVWLDPHCCDDSKWAIWAFDDADWRYCICLECAKKFDHLTVKQKYNRIKEAIEEKHVCTLYGLPNDPYAAQLYVVL